MSEKARRHHTRIRKSTSCADTTSRRCPCRRSARAPSCSRASSTTCPIPAELKPNHRPTDSPRRHRTPRPCSRRHIRARGPRTSPARLPPRHPPRQRQRPAPAAGRPENLSPEDMDIDAVGLLLGEYYRTIQGAPNRGVGRNRARTTRAVVHELPRTLGLSHQQLPRDASGGAPSTTRATTSPASPASSLAVR